MANEQEDLYNGDDLGMGGAYDDNQEIPVGGGDEQMGTQQESAEVCACACLITRRPCFCAKTHTQACMSARVPTSLFSTSTHRACALAFHPPFHLAI
jgi:hypothetical protein